MLGKNNVYWSTKLKGTRIHVHQMYFLSPYSSVRYVHVMADVELFKALLDIFPELTPLTVMKDDLKLTIQIFLLQSVLRMLP